MMDERKFLHDLEDRGQGWGRVVIIDHFKEFGMKRVGVVLSRVEWALEIHRALYCYNR